MAGQSKIAVHPSAPRNPELLLRWLLSGIDSVECVAVVWRRKATGTRMIRASNGFNCEDAAMASGMMMQVAMEIAETASTEGQDGCPAGYEDVDEEDPAS